MPMPCWLALVSGLSWRVLHIYKVLPTIFLQVDVARNGFPGLCSHSLDRFVQAFVLNAYRFNLQVDMCSLKNTSFAGSEKTPLLVHL